METKKLVVELAANIKLQKLWYEKTVRIPEEIGGVGEEYISANKQIKILALCKLIKENENLTKQELKEVLKKRPVLFRYYRYLLKEYPNFIELAKTAGPYYFIFNEQYKQKEKLYDLP